MSQPVKLSDELVLDARLAGETLRRSIAGQVEFWATLGRGIETLLNGRQAIALCRSGVAEPVSRLLATADSPVGRERVAAVLEQQPFPHYRPYPGKRGLLERTDAGGKRTIGRFVNREFKAVRIRTRTAASAK
ncbi:MAG TPA: hypothetical protein VKB38_20525 [Terracidiphilus sp.]|nr:hypothetical protein [Terracidiphilus sp.]